MPDTVNARATTWSSPVSALYRVLIAWSLAPLAVVVVLLPHLSVAAFVAWFAVVIALAIVGARDFQSRAGQKTSVFMTLLTATPTIIGYVTAVIWSMPFAVLLGASLTTALATGYLVRALRRAR